MAQHLFEETNCILNLASKEYSLCVSRHLQPSIRFITCVFGEEKDGKVVEKGAKCKMARGEMVRYLAAHQAEDLQTVQSFDRLNYQYAPQYSDQDTYVILQQESAPGHKGRPV